MQTLTLASKDNSVREGGRIGPLLMESLKKLGICLGEHPVKVQLILGGMEPLDAAEAVIS